MKKLINDVESVEEQMILGLVKSAPHKLRKLSEGNIVVRVQKKEGKVALISGGGSGHEPAHAGFVGEEPDPSFSPLGVRSVWRRMSHATGA